MARLVAATCPKCGAGVRLDPALEISTCKYCGTSSFVQTERRAPTEQVLNARQPVIQVSASREPWPWVMVAVTVLGAIVSLAFFLRARNATTREPRASASQTTAPASVAPPVIAPPPIPVFFEDARPIRWILDHHLGSPLRLVELTIHDRTLVVQAQAPKEPTHVDRHFWGNGKFDLSSPVALDKARLKVALFDSAELDFGLVPKICADALLAAKLDGAAVSHIIVKRPLPFRREVIWRVYVKNERETEMCDYSLKGKRLR